MIPSSSMTFVSTAPRPRSFVVDEEAGVEHRVDVGPELCRIDRRKGARSTQDLLERQLSTREGNELGDGLAVAGDREPFAGLDAIEHITPVVP